MNKREKELFRLMSAKHDGLHDDSVDERIAELLEGNEALQRRYLEYGVLFHELEETFLGQQAEMLVKDFPAKRSPRVIWLSSVAAIAASLFVAFFLFMGREQSVELRSPMLVDEGATILYEDSFEPIARMITSSDLVWGSDNQVEMHGNELEPGLLDLQEGSMEVVFENGVRFGLKAPVCVELSSPQRLDLYHGSLAVHVPGLAEGLTITTPDAVLKAHTVQAQISAGEGRSTLVDVESGALDLFTEDRRGSEIRRSIVRRESMEIAKGTDSPITETRKVKDLQFDLSLPPELENLRYAHYSFDETFRNGTVKNLGNIPEGDGWLAGIAARPEYPAPRQVPGRFGKALECSGNGEGMLADLKEFGSDEPGSVAFWIKMAPDTVPRECEYIFSWHMYSTPEKKWHEDDKTELACRIRINNNASKGVVGAVLIEFRNQWICGTTDLRDGRWHHVTTLFHRGYYGTRVQHYIDGKIARSSARGETWFPLKRSEVGGGSIAVGRVYWPKFPSHLPQDSTVGLQGAIDELYVFDQPVLPSHASRLFMENNPGQITKVGFAPANVLSLAMFHPFYE